MTRELAFVALLLVGCSSQADSGTRGLPDGALVFTGQLPACNVPASLNKAGRTFLACADCFEQTGSMCSIGIGDTATDCQSCGPCVMACEPDQYAVVSQSGSPPWDAGNVRQTLPPGCGGDLPAMQNFLDHHYTTGGIWTITCCPCH